MWRAGQDPCACPRHAHSLDHCVKNDLGVEARGQPGDAQVAREAAAERHEPPQRQQRVPAAAAAAGAGAALLLLRVEAAGAGRGRVWFAHMYTYRCMCLYMRMHARD